MTTVEVLRAARALIDTPEKWGKGGYQDDCLCAGEAINIAQGFERASYEGTVSSAYVAFREAIGGKLVGPWNDRSKHADGLAAFDRAIEAEEAKA